MSLQTAKMIYDQPEIAHQISAMMTETTGKPYEVYKLPQGWQVVSITKLKSGMPPKKPLPVMKPAPKTNVEAQAANEFVIVLKFRGESNAYVDVWHPVTGAPMSFGKTTLLGWLVSDDKTQVTLRMLSKVAKKRGLLAA